MINIDPVLLISVFVLFIFLLVSLNSILFKPMLKHIDAREVSLKENQEKANESYELATSLDTESAEILADAKRQAHKNTEETLDKQRLENEKMLEDEKKQIETQMQKFLQDLEVQKQELKDQIALKSADFTNAIKSKMAM